jgi:hypothetical protein
MEMSSDSLSHWDADGNLPNSPGVPTVSPTVDPNVYPSTGDNPVKLADLNQDGDDLGPTH